MLSMQALITVDLAESMYVNACKERAGMVLVTVTLRGEACHLHWISAVH